MLFFANILMAQDMFFTQFYNAPLVLNPALTGFSSDDMQLTMNYRDNSQGLIPHSTYAGSGTIKVARLLLRPNTAGVGVIASMDDFSSGKIKTLNILVSGAYHMALTKDATHFASVGTQIGFFQRQSNANSFSYPSQWDDNIGYTAGSSNYEMFQDESVFRPDVNVGAFYYGKVNNTLSAFSGISFSHINNPKVSFLGEDARFSSKYLIHGGARYKVNTEIDIIPNFIIVFQGRARQIVEGASMEYKITDTPHAIRFGTWYRHSDRGFIAMAGWKVNNFQLAVSSDFITRLQRVSRSRSALEFSIIYTGALKEKVTLNANPRNTY